MSKVFLIEIKFVRLGIIIGVCDGNVGFESFEKKLEFFDQSMDNGRMMKEEYYALYNRISG
jgi:hypothetical protein